MATTLTSKGMETADQTVSRAKALINPPKPTPNSRGGINKQSNRERTGAVASGATGTGDTFVQGAGAVAQPVTPVSTKDVSTVITSDELEGAAGNDVKLPDTPKEQTFDTGVTEESVAADQQTELQRLEAENEKRAADLKAGFDNQKMGDFENQISEDAGLQAKRVEKTKYDNQVLAKQREYDLAVRDKQDEAGLTRAQKNASLREISKNFNRELADLSIIQMAKAGEFNDAQAYVNRKVELEFADRKAELEGLKFLYSENKDRLTLVEQRAFNKTIQAEDRAYTEEYNEKQQFENFRLSLIQNAINNGKGAGVLSAIQSAEDMESLLKVPGIQTPQKTGAAPQPKNIGTSDNPIWAIYDSATNSFIPVEGAGANANTAKQALVLTAQEQQMDTLDSIFDSKAIDSVVGTSFLSRAPTGVGSVTSRILGMGTAGAGVGAGVGLLGGPAAPVSVPLGAAVGFVGGVATGIANSLQGSKDKLTGDRSDLIADVSKMTAQMTLDKLITAKARGATFGSLQVEEMRKLEEAASQLNTWAIKDKEGNVLGYDTSEKSFYKEIDTLKYYAVLDHVRSGGDPLEKGAIQAPDGTYGYMSRTEFDENGNPLIYPLPPY